MIDNGKRYKIVWRDGEILKAREGFAYELNIDCVPMMITFHTQDGDYIISGNAYVGVEPVKER